MKGVLKTTMTSHNVIDIVMIPRMAPSKLDTPQVFNICQRNLMHKPTGAYVNTLFRIIFTNNRLRIT